MARIADGLGLDHDTITSPGSPGRKNYISLTRKHLSTTVRLVPEAAYDHDTWELFYDTHGSWHIHPVPFLVDRPEAFMIMDGDRGPDDAEVESYGPAQDSAEAVADLLRSMQGGDMDMKSTNPFPILVSYGSVEDNNDQA